MDETEQLKSALEAEVKRRVELEGDLVAVRANKEGYEKRCAEYIDRIVELEGALQSFSSPYLKLQKEKDDLESKLTQANERIKELDDLNTGLNASNNFLYDQEQQYRQKFEAANAKIVELEGKREIELDRAYMIGQGSAHTGKYYSKDEFLKMCKDGFK